MIAFRISHALWQHNSLRALALLLQNYVIRISGAEIHPAARIGPGLNLVHANGVVIGDKVVLGAHARIYQQVTLGDDGRHPGQPSVGHTAVFGAGCKVLGPVVIGNGVTIGANAVVLTNLADNVVATGVPARSHARLAETSI